MTLPRCWSLSCFAPFAGTKDATSLSPGESVTNPLSAASDTSFAREVTAAADTSFTLEARFQEPSSRNTRAPNGRSAPLPEWHRTLVIRPLRDAACHRIRN